EATDRMAVMLGLQLGNTGGAAEATKPVDLVLQRVRAALLSDQFDTASALLSGLDDEQRKDFRVRYELAALEAQRGRDKESIAAFEQRLVDIPADGDPVLIAKVQYALGNAYKLVSDYAKADDFLQQAHDTIDAETGYDARLLAGKIQMMI